jgi:predicted flap endonuclease-1-like 5' DNA nuclease
VAKAAPKTAKPKAPAKAKTATPNITFDLAAAKAAGFNIKQADDLTAIEGIGPKINDLFKENGVTTFAQLAKQTVPQMRAILDKGGARYRIANPATWAQQADLAANNQWTELKKLQDALSGGVKK